MDSDEAAALRDRALVGLRECDPLARCWIDSYYLKGVHHVRAHGLRLHGQGPVACAFCNGDLWAVAASLGAAWMYDEEGDMSTCTDYRVSVCVDCLLTFAGYTHDEAPDVPADQWERIAAQWPGADGYTTFSEDRTDDGDVEPHFSWSRCETCGSTLGGDRFDGTLTFWEG